jgi:predicted ATPase/DNA-binding SARP family transcriptional activator
VERDGQPVAISRNKSLALLAYLALSGQPQQRDGLLALLWPELDADAARNNLRRELSLLKAALGEQAIAADRAQLRWNAPASWLDVGAFRELLAAKERHGHAPGELCPQCAQALAAAAQLYRDDLLAGFGLSDCPAFDEWQFFQREELRQRLAGALEALARWHGEAGAHEQAVPYARRWVALDRLHEPAQRALMRAYALAGQTGAALRQYEECARLLESELGAKPEQATRELYDQIRTRTIASHGAKEPRSPEAKGLDSAAALSEDAVSPSRPLALSPSSAKRGALPTQATSFVGREQELAALEGYCAEPHIRMITIVGAGGMGKTRLAIELAARQRGAYADGVHFAALQAVGGAEQMVAAVAEALGCPLTGAERPQEQLLAYLRSRRLLLVLDNIEHLLAADEATAGLLARIYAAAPGVRLLITSREVLNLQEEWPYPLGGLALPPPGADEQIDGSDAVRCFLERARRARPDFAWERERADVARICRLVEGMPLAIELAAAWTRTLSCGAIAAEIERNLAFLTTRLRNLPERHRSVRAALDYSWALLTEHQRAVFARLSVFRNGFVPAAAARVAGATLDTLAAFVDKSLLQCDRSGRYRLHELLRQYAAEHLAADPEAAGEAQRAHADYFVALLRGHFDNVLGADQLQALREIGAEIDNIRLAWQHIVGAGDAEAIEASHHVLAFFFEIRCMYHEGLATFEAAGRALRSGALTPGRAAPLAGLLVDQAALMLHLGQIAQARAALEASEALYAQFGLPLPPGQTTDPLYWLGIVSHIEGDFAATARLGERARRRSEQAGHKGNLGPSWYLSTLAALTQGQWRAAQFYAEQAYAAVQETGDRWSLGHCHHHLANALVELGDFEQAGAHYRAAYAICEAFEHQQGMAIALMRLGRVALRQGDYATARELYGRSLPIVRELGDRGAESETRHGLARAALGLGEPHEARRELAPALALAAEIAWALLTLRVAITVAELLLQTGQPELGATVLVVALRHPATDRATGDRAQRLLLRAEAVIPADTFAGAVQQGQQLELDALVWRLRVALVHPPQQLDAEPGLHRARFVPADRLAELSPP